MSTRQCFGGRVMFGFEQIEVRPVKAGQKQTVAHNVAVEISVIAGGRQERTGQVIAFLIKYTHGINGIDFAGFTTEIPWPICRLSWLSGVFPSGVKR